MSEFGIIFERATEVVDVPTAFAMLRLNCATTDVLLAAQTVLRLLNNALDSPEDPTRWLVRTGNDALHANLFRHLGGKELLKAVGFISERTRGGEDMLVLRGGLSSQRGSPVVDETLLKLVRDRRSQVEEELHFMEGEQSIPAVLRELLNHCTRAEAREAADTLLTYINNVLKNPKDPRFLRIRANNPIFQRRIGRLNGSTQFMAAGCFPQSEDGITFVLKGFQGSDFRQAGKYFTFPSVSKETESLLWRRKRDLEAACRSLDSPDSSFLGVGAAKVCKEPQSPAKGRSGRKAEKLIKKDKVSFKSSSAAALKLMYENASSVKRAQLKMVETAFNRFAQTREFITAVDVRRTFREMGRGASDKEVMRWIKEHDVDQDGRVSLSEFMLSFGHLMQRNIDAPEVEGELGVDNLTKLHGLPTIAAAIGSLRLAVSTEQLVVAIETVDSFIAPILEDPTNSSRWRISVSSTAYVETLREIDGGLILLNSCGFILEENSSVLAFKGPPRLKEKVRKRWSSVPAIVLEWLSNTRAALKSQLHALEFPNVSNIMAVESAVELLLSAAKNDNETLSTALHTIVLMLENILSEPEKQKYRKVNTANKNFHRRVGKLAGGHQMLVAIGFRETADGGLILPMDVDLSNLLARKMELEAAIPALARYVSQQAKSVENESYDLTTEANVEKVSVSKTPSPVKSAKAGSEKKIVSVKKKRPSKPRTESEDVEKKRIRDLELQVEQLKGQLANTMGPRENSILARMPLEEQKLTTELAKSIGMQHAGTVQVEWLPDSSAITSKMWEELSSRSAAEFLAFQRQGSIDDGNEQASSNMNSWRPSATAMKKGNKDPAKGKVKKRKDTGRKKVEYVSTVLSAHVASACGRVHVASTDGFVVGHKVRIGTGDFAEERFIIAVGGGLVLNTDLAYPHVKGEPVLKVQASAREKKQFHHQQTRSYVRSVILAPLVAMAAAVGEAVLKARDEQEEFERRPVQKPVFSVCCVLRRSLPKLLRQHQQPIASSIVVLPHLGKMAVFSGHLSEDVTMSSHQLVVFEEGNLLADFRHVFDIADVNGDSSVLSPQLMNAIRLTPPVSTIFSSREPVGGGFNPPSFEEAAQSILERSEATSWEVFQERFLPRLQNGKGEVKAEAEWRADTWANSISEDDVSCLRQVFAQYDLNRSGKIFLSEFEHLCLHLDGFRPPRERMIKWLTTFHAQAVLPEQLSPMSALLSFSNFVHFRVWNASTFGVYPGATITAEPTPPFVWGVGVLSVSRQLLCRAYSQLLTLDGVVDKNAFISKLSAEPSYRPLLKVPLFEDTGALNCTLQQALDNLQSDCGLSLLDVLNCIRSHSPHTLFSKPPLMLAPSALVTPGTAMIASSSRKAVVFEVCADSSCDDMYLLRSNGSLEVWGGVTNSYERSMQLIFPQPDSHLFLASVSAEGDITAQVPSHMRASLVFAARLFREVKCAGEKVGGSGRPRILDLHQQTGLLIVNTTIVDGYVSCHESTSGKRVWATRLKLPRKDTQGEPYSVFDFVYCHEEHVLITVLLNAPMVLTYSTVDGGVLSEMLGHTALPPNLLFVPHSRHLVTGGRSQRDSVLRIWNLGAELFPHLKCSGDSSVLLPQQLVARALRVLRARALKVERWIQSAYSSFRELDGEGDNSSCRGFLTRHLFRAGLEHTMSVNRSPLALSAVEWGALLSRFAIRGIFHTPLFPLLSIALKAALFLSSLARM